MLPVRVKGFESRRRLISGSCPKKWTLHRSHVVIPRHRKGYLAISNALMTIYCSFFRASITEPDLT
jgi:hypothetical protein